MTTSSKEEIRQSRVNSKEEIRQLTARLDDSNTKNGELEEKLVAAEKKAKEWETKGKQSQVMVQIEKETKMKIEGELAKFKKEYADICQELFEAKHELVRRDKEELIQDHETSELFANLEQPSEGKEKTINEDADSHILEESDIIEEKTSKEQSNLSDQSEAKKPLKSTSALTNPISIGEQFTSEVRPQARAELQHAVEPDPQQQPDQPAESQPETEGLKSIGSGSTADGGNRD